MAKTKVRASASNATARWVQGLSAATQRMKDGVDAVQTAPGVAAAGQKQAYIQGVTNSVDKWAANVAAVPLSDWKSAMDLGISRVAAGAQAKQSKYQNFATKFYPYLEQGMQQIANMPHNNVEDGVQRSAAMIRWNAKFKMNG